MSLRPFAAVKVSRSGYLLKSCIRKDLRDAIRLVHEAGLDTRRTAHATDVNDRTPAVIVAAPRGFIDI